MKQLMGLGVMLVGCVAVLGASSASAQLAPADVDVPTGEVALGTVSLPRSVMADGQTLSAGSYDVRLTARPAAPETAGALNVL